MLSHAHQNTSIIVTYLRMPFRPRLGALRSMPCGAVVDYFREHDVEVHIHCPAWAKCQFDDLVEEGLDDYVVLHWVDIPDYDTERDDKDLLAWALLTNGYIVSNDMMQNHIENGSIKLEWFAIRRIPYHFTKIGEFRPKLPTEFPLPRRKEND